MSRKKVKKQKVNSKISLILVVAAVIIGAYFIFNNLNKKDSSGESTTLKRFTGFDFTKQGELTFDSNEGDFISKIDIEIADTPEKRQIGLMYRVSMREDRGMLFIFEREEPQSFWMHNTEIPLDIIFVNSKMEIVKIHKNTQPFNDTSLPSVRPAKFVVEVNAGYTDKFKIKEGDKIVWRRL